MNRKKRVYVAFEYDPDRRLKELLIGQSRHAETPFEVFDHSLKEAAPEKDWLDKAESHIKRADVVVVLLGATTHKAKGVAKEIAIARREKKKVVQIIGYKGVKYRRIPGAGRLYAWTWDNLKKLLR
jgi:hypothetical protein